MNARAIAADCTLAPKLDAIASQAMDNFIEHANGCWICRRAFKTFKASEMEPKDLCVAGGQLNRTWREAEQRFSFAQKARVA